MKKFRKVWTPEINAWLKTTKGMTPGEAYELFLKTYPDIKDVTRIAFCNQRSRMGAAGPSYNPKFSRAPRPLYSEQIKKGYVRIKIAQPNVWISKAKWVYMETHPEEYEICSTTRANYIFLDGNTRNFHPDNIARVPLNIMSVFNSLGGTVDGNPELTWLRLTQAILKSKILDKMEECGKVNKYATYRSDKQRAHEHYLKAKARPGFKEHQREVAREYLRRLKVERPEKYAEILRKNRERRKMLKKIINFFLFFLLTFFLYGYIFINVRGQESPKEYNMTATKEITSASVIKALDERQSLKAQIEEMNAKIKELEASIENEIGQGTFHCNGYSISCLDKDTTRFDTTRFKAEQPEVYAEYCKTSTVHSFTVRELVEK